MNINQKMQNAYITRNSHRNKLKESEQNSKTLNELIKDERYLNGLSIFIDQGLFQDNLIDWLSNVSAVDLISTKNIDVFVYDENGLVEDETISFDTILKKNLLEMKIYELAKRASINGIAGIWFMPNITNPFEKFSLNADVQIVQYKILNNEPQAVSFVANLVKGQAIGSIYAFIFLNHTRISTRFYSISDEDIDNVDWKNESELSKYEISTLDFEKLLKDNQSLNFNSGMLPFLNYDHNLGFLPFCTLYFNENFIPVINTALFQQDFNELFAIATKMYDEANMMGTKIKWVNDGDINSMNSKHELLKMIKIMGSLAGVYTRGDFNSDNQNADVDIITKAPVYNDLFDAFKNKLNYILKKMGLSSDTDSKGTVQQSISEIIKQNQFSYNLQNYRNVILQNFLQDIIEKFYQANKTINNHYKIKVLSTQSLGMSEMEKLNYVIMAKSNGLIDQARGIAILTGKNYIDSLQLAKLQKLQDTSTNPDLNKNHNEGGGAEYD